MMLRDHVFQPVELDAGQCSILCACGWVAPPQANELDAADRFVDHLMDVIDPTGVLRANQ